MSGPRIGRGGPRSVRVAARERQLASRIDAISWATRRVGHALNNELTVILENARWLAEGDGRGESTAAASDLRESGERCATLASVLLRWTARVQCDAPPRRLRELLAETRPLLAAFATDVPELAVELPSGRDPVVEDPERTSRMLVYLAAGAVEVLGTCARVRARELQRAGASASVLELRAEGGAGGAGQRERVARRLDGAEPGDDGDGALPRASALAREIGAVLRVDAGPGDRAALAIRLPLGRDPA